MTKKIDIVLRVTGVTVLTGNGTDKIFFNTTLAEGVFPYAPNSGSFSIDAARGLGVAYVETNWPELASITKVIKTSC